MNAQAEAAGAEKGLAARWWDDLRTLPRDLRRGWREARIRGAARAVRVRTLDRAYRRGRLFVFEQDLSAMRETEPPSGVRITDLPPSDAARLAQLVRGGKLRRFERALAAGRTCLVAWRAEQPVGYTWISRSVDPALETYPFPLPPDAAYLWDLYVVPEERNSGIGTALVSARLRRARELGFRRAWRAIEPRNRPSLRILEKTAREEPRLVGEMRYVKILRRLRARFHPAADADATPRP